jgi:hypothetical protein
MDETLEWTGRNRSSAVRELQAMAAVAPFCP